MKSRTSRITIGRLYNLGNYEHIRYEITVEIPEGQLASTALIGLENILTALNPKKPSGVLDDGDLRRAEAQIEKLKTEPDDEVVKFHGRSKAVILHEWEKKLAASKDRTFRWQNSQTRARALLDDLGGAAEFRDAKPDWDTDYEF